ncbi:unnamed protein product [Urochloa humidicola]
MSSTSDNSNESEEHYTSEEDDALLTWMSQILNSRAPRRVPQQTGMQWMMETMANEVQCRSMFRLTPNQIHCLHGLLTTRYHLQGSYEVCTMEALGMFLFTMAGAQPNRSTNNRMVRSGSTVSIYFHRVLNAMNAMAADILKPVDPNFEGVHPRIMEDVSFHPFHGSIGAVDGTHVHVVVPRQASMVHRGRPRKTTKNVLVVVGWDDRIIFADAGTPGSTHDQRALSSDIRRYRFTFPRPSFGKYFLVDSGYSCRYGFLPPYMNVRYHTDEWEAAQPVGREEHYNFLHSSLRNAIERVFGIVKGQWRILKGIPYFPDPTTQPSIILAAFALHNFRMDISRDPHFITQNPLYNGYPIQPVHPPLADAYDAPNSEIAMSQLREAIADMVFNS